MKKVILISCVSKKLPYKAKAKDLYISDLFKKSLRYAQSLCLDKIFFLSANYGLTGLEDSPEPYDITLSNMPEAQRKDWAAMVLARLHSRKFQFRCI